MTSKGVKEAEIGEQKYPFSEIERQIACLHVYYIPGRE